MAQNNTKSKISIDSLLIHPYSPSSAIALMFPGFDLFSSRTQFIPFERQSHLAVCIEALNLSYNTRRRTSRQSFFINIRDVKTGEIVASRTHCIVMENDQEHIRERVDIPFRRSQFNPEHEHMVEVTLPGSDEVLISRELNYIMSTKLPTHYYTAVAAYVEKTIVDNASNPVTLHLSAISGPEEGETVTFCLENNVVDLPRLPELFMKFFSREDSSLIRQCHLTEYEENGVKRVKASCEIPFPFCTEGHLYVELLSMGYHFAGVLIEMTGEEEGEMTGEELAFIQDYFHEKGSQILEKRKKEADISTDPEPEKEQNSSVMDSLVGLEGVKSKLSRYKKLMWFFRQRRKIGLHVPATPLHCLFLGSPGTGKTTVAKEFGRIMYQCGALSKGHVVVRERATLLGQFYNSEAEKTLAALEEARGGILFIDEAYQLYQPSDPKDPGRFVLESLLTALADTDDRDWMLIMAGYTEPMLKMMSLNPGLASRIPEVNFYRFEDFTESQLTEIAVRYLDRNSFTLSPEAKIVLVRRLAEDYAHRGEGFGNGRHVVNLIETEILPAMAARLSELSGPTREDLTTILPEDIPSPTILPVIERRRIGFAS